MSMWRGLHFECEDIEYPSPYFLCRKALPKDMPVFLHSLHWVDCASLLIMWPVLEHPPRVRRFIPKDDLPLHTRFLDCDVICPTRQCYCIKNKPIVMSIPPRDGSEDR